MKPANFSPSIAPVYHSSQPPGLSVQEYTGNGIYITRRSSKLVRKDSDQSLSALVHELRNPLTSITLAIEFLESGPIDEKMKPFVDIIKRGSVRLNDLVSEVLRYKCGEVRLEKHSVCQLLDEVLELISDRASLKDIAVIKRYNGDCEPVLNGPEMKMALTNIIINAIDAMEAGKGQLQLITSTFEGKCKLVIRDNGCGISNENLEKIFKPYFTNKPGGVGLGLTATESILRGNHVRVAVESEEGKGTQFILLFDGLSRKMR